MLCEGDNIGVQLFVERVHIRLVLADALRTYTLHVLGELRHSTRVRMVLIEERVLTFLSHCFIIFSVDQSTSSSPMLITVASLLSQMRPTQPAYQHRQVPA